MPAWTPNLLSELFAWYKADSLSLSNGDPISTLSDSDSGTYSLTASGGARPTYTANALNSLPVMTFSGAQWLTSGTTNPWSFLNKSGGGTIISVWKAGNASNPNTLYGLYGTNGGTVTAHGTYCFWDDRASVPRNEVIVLATRNNNTGGSGTVFYDSATGNDFFTPNTPHLLTCIHDNANATAANKLRVSVDGGTLNGANTSTRDPSTSNPAQAFQLGACGNNVFPMTGYIAEVCVFNSVLSTTNYQLIEGYLAWKWGLQANLPSGHPYKNAAPTIGRARRLINDGLFNRGLFNAGLAR